MLRLRRTNADSVVNQVSVVETPLMSQTTNGRNTANGTHHVESVKIGESHDGLDTVSFKYIQQDEMKTAQRTSLFVKAASAVLAAGTVIIIFADTTGGGELAALSFLAFLLSMAVLTAQSLSKKDKDYTSVTVLRKDFRRALNALEIPNGKELLKAYTLAINSDYDIAEVGRNTIDKASDSLRKITMDYAIQEQKAIEDMLSINSFQYDTYKSLLNGESVENSFGAQDEV